jgi:hypothetical protein
MIHKTPFLTDLLCRKKARVDLLVKLICMYPGMIMFEFVTPVWILTTLFYVHMVYQAHLGTIPSPACSNATRAWEGAQGA